MKISKKELLSHILNVVTIALIVECFLCCMLLVNKYGRENCFVRIEENTKQMSQMFVQAMEEDQDNLTVFAGILAANDSNPDRLLQLYMENFCTTQDFDAVCIHRANGTVVYYGEHPHDAVIPQSFEEEVARVPYVSDAIGHGDKSHELFVYQAVPIIRNGETLAILYGYLSLDGFPHLISSSAFGGKAQFIIVNGDNGDFLLNEAQENLGNVFDESMDRTESKPGYDLHTMHEDIRSGSSGYYVSKSNETGHWYYTYYMPIGINNWSMHMTIDEPTAFASYHHVNNMLVMLAICVILLMLIHVLALMSQQRRSTKKDKQNLHKSQYINSVQRALINAHNTPGFLGQALKIIADEMEAETVLLLAFRGATITNVYYWPSKDRVQAMDMVGRNAREQFPVVFDLLASKESVIYDEKDSSFAISDTAIHIFSSVDANNVLMVPITDNSGVLKGVIAAVNSAKENKSCEMLECVTYDLFMALSNQESYAIIQRMGTMDYLTNVKNRNSFETEISNYASLEADCLWCAFVDVNGLHEVNNTRGHKAGDLMLCAVADAVKKVFGEQWTYRFGGDEFVVFAADASENEMLRRKGRIERELAVKDYYVSIGFACIEKNSDGIFEVERVIADAEAIMYQEKWNYYKQHNISTERGNFPNGTGNDLN